MKYIRRCLHCWTRLCRRWRIQCQTIEIELTRSSISVVGLHCCCCYCWFVFVGKKLHLFTRSQSVRIRWVRPLVCSTGRRILHASQTLKNANVVEKFSRKFRRRSTKTIEYWRRERGETIYRAIGFVHCLGISDRGFSGVSGTGTLDNEANGSFRSPTFGSGG